MEEAKHKETYTFADVNTKRLFFALIGLLLIIGGITFWAKNNLPRFLAEQQEKVENNKNQGSVAGEMDIDLGNLQGQIDEIKKSVSDLKSEDLVKQKPVQKILDDLEELKKKATESAKVFDVKGNLCEEVKKRFCK